MMQEYKYNVLQNPEQSINAGNLPDVVHLYLYI
jgi:hypothetical protein